MVPRHAGIRAATTTSVSENVDGLNRGTRAFCSRTISRIRTPFRPNGARSSRAARAASSRRFPGCSGCWRRPRTATGTARRAEPRLRCNRRLPTRPARRDAARGRRRCDGARQGPSDARSSRGQARPARLRADGRPGARRDVLIPSLTPELQARIPSSLLRVHVPGETLLEALPALKEVYCGTIAYEIEHLSDHAERVWLRQAIESGRYRRGAPARGAQASCSPRSPAPRGSSSSSASASSARSSSRSRGSTR